MERVVIDPVTRIEGHLRIELELEDGKVRRAFSSGTMVRGIEKILKGRDPRDAWAFTQRFCGVCTTVHAIASVRAVEDALKINIPKNANLIRNLIIAQQFVHDHVMHFYHLHALDWVDIPSALNADPGETSRIAQKISSWPNSSPGYFADVQDKLKNFVASGQLGIFANGYWGHQAYKLPPEVNLLAAAHYLEALDWQKDVVQLHAVFGGKNPHPNFLVGGVPSPLDLNQDNALNVERLSLVANSIEKMVKFVEEVYLPDLLAIAPFYPEWASLGENLHNFLVWGEFPDEKGERFIPNGVILDGNLKDVQEADPFDKTGVQEFIAHSWYRYLQGDKIGLHPFDGQTELNYTGPQPPYEYLEVEKKYSWLKSPRWKGKAMEVGPLARLLVMYARGVPEAKELVDETLKKLNLPLQALFSTLGRTAARALETKIIASKMSGWYAELLENIKEGDLQTWNSERWEPSTWPDEAQGFGYMEAPRGALGHWIKIRDGKIANYQAVVPTTWNASPRDALGQAGAYETSLLGTPVADASKPVEILRTIHSFDPCLACAVHILSKEKQEVMKIEILPSTLVDIRLERL